LKSVDWEKFDMAEVSQEVMDLITDSFAAFFMAHTSTELYEGAKKRRIMLYPVTDPRDIAENPQLAARGYWEDELSAVADQLFVIDEEAAAEQGDNADCPG